MDSPAWCRFVRSTATNDKVKKVEIAVRSNTMRVCSCQRGGEKNKRRKYEEKVRRLEYGGTVSWLDGTRAKGTRAQNDCSSPRDFWSFPRGHLASPPQSL